jgi:hypothetical protein
MDDSRQALVSSATATGLAGLTLMHPGLAVPAAAAQAWVEAAVNTVVDRVSAWRRERIAGVVISASAIDGPVVEDLVDSMAQDPASLELFTRTMQAASDAARPDKLRALARCLRAAYDDRAAIDDELLMIAAINAIDGPHIRVLDALSRSPAGTAIAPDASPEDYPHEPSYNTQQLALLIPGAEHSPPAILGVLSMAGLVESRGTTGAMALLGLPGPISSSIKLTPMGIRLLSRLQEVA